MSTKILRCDSGGVKVEYAGEEYFFEGGEEREVPADLADSAQYRYGHLGLRIVHPGVKATPAPQERAPERVELPEEFTPAPKKAKR